MKTCSILLPLFLCVCVWTTPAVCQQKAGDSSGTSQAAERNSVDEREPKNASAKQEPGPNSGARDLQLHVFRLQHLQAGQALETIQRLLGEWPIAKGMRFAVDPHANRVLAYVDEPTKQAISALLVKLDQPERTAESEPQLKILKLHYASPSNVQRALQALSLGAYTSFADERTKTLFVRGSDDAIDRLMTLVKQLDVDVTSPAAQPREALSLRIVWLVDKSLAGAEAPPVPDDWKDSIERLRKRVEFGELRMATQMLITFNPVPGTQFAASGDARLKGKCKLQATGFFTQQTVGGPQLTLELTVKMGETERSLQTTCSGALQWQPLILGMTTVDSHPSLFVIQFVPN